MAGAERRSLRTPDEHVEYPLGFTDEVHLGELVVGRSLHQPGWRWSEHLKPIVGTSSCQTHHVGVLLRGRFGVRTDEGQEMTFGPDDVYDIPPGHDGWVIGEEPAELLEWVGVHRWATEPSGERVLATIVFTDIVDSTATATRLGDRAWTRLLEEHDAVVRTALDRFRGREVATTGDGVVAIFDGAERALRAASMITDRVRGLELTIRAAVHTGEIELVPNNIRGVAVHVAARILALAQPGEVLVSDVTRGLIDSTDLTFLDRGRHVLKGVSGERGVYSLERVPSSAASNSPT